MNLSGEKKKPGYLQLIAENCHTFLKKNLHPQFLQVLSCNEEKPHFPIMVDYLQLFEEFPAIGELLLKCAEKVLNIFDAAAKRVLLDVYDELRGGTNPPSNLALGPETLKSKLNLHIRIHGLPMCAELTRVHFPNCKECDSFLCILGTVVRSSSAKLLEYSKTYECNKCKERVEVVAPASRYHSFPRYAECANVCPNAKVVPMGDSNAKNAENYSKFRDYQEIKLQEQIHKMQHGSMPKAITVILEEDLVGSCKPGDDVAMTGFFYLRWKPFKAGFPSECELVFKTNHVLVNNDQRVSMIMTEDMKNFVQSFWSYYQPDPFEGRNIIISSFCPQIYGMYVVKLAMCLVLAGGVSKQIAGTRIRGESHLLLVGDPGTGKSQLLKYAAKISPRSVFTTGIGTSAAGLTVSATKENGEWHLEAGALVLADCGVCCIDEFSCIKDQDRTSIHEAMEQQTISVAKAGMVVKLSTRVTLIAATNPRSKYNPLESLTVNVGIASPLLSRFDVVMVLQDAENDDWDSFITDFVLDGKDNLNEAVKETTDIWDTERLQSYLVMIKDLEPEMTPAASEVIKTYYAFQRGLENRIAARTTVRLLESLRRLSEGHARLMFRQQVLLHDAISAISLLEASMQSSAIVSASNSLHTAFPLDPMEEYRNQARVILEKLGLHHLWESERQIIDALKIARAAKRNGVNVVPPPPPFTPPTLPPRPSTSTSSSSPEFHPPRTEIPEVSQELERRRREDESDVISALMGRKRHHSSSSSSTLNSDSSGFSVKLSGFLDKDGEAFAGDGGNLSPKLFSSSEDDDSGGEEPKPDNLTPGSARKQEIRSKLSRFKKARVQD